MTTFRRHPRLLGGLALALLLGYQALESSHLHLSGHLSGVDAPECVQCQSVPTPALPPATVAPVLAAAGAFLLPLTPAALGGAFPRAFLARGPPVPSSTA